MAKLNVMKAFMPLRTNRTSQATAVQVAHGSSFFAAACGPGVDIFRLDNIDKGVLYEKSFTMEYLGQLLQAQDGMTLALGVKFTSKPGIIVAAVLRLDTSMPKIELVLKDIKVDPTHGIEEDIVQNGARARACLDEGGTVQQLLVSDTREYCCRERTHKMVLHRTY